MKSRFALLALSTSLAASILVAASPAFAADDVADAAEASSPFDVYFGVAFTSNYVSRGATQTDDDPAIQGYVEAAYDMFYAGVWASNVSFGGFKDTEYDFYAGIRPEFGDLSLDIGYAEYYYPDDPCECGEFYAKADYALTETYSAGAEIYLDPRNDTQWGVLTSSVALPEEFSLSGQIGYDFESDGLVAWDAGVSRTFMDIATLDLRYYDSNFDPARFVATLSFDLSLSALTE